MSKRGDIYKALKQCLINIKGSMDIIVELQVLVKQLPKEDRDWIATKLETYYKKPEDADKQT